MPRRLTGTEPEWSERHNAWTVRARIDGKRRLVVIAGARDARDAARLAPTVIAAVRRAGIEAQKVAASPAGRTVLEQARAWIDLQTYGDVAEDRGRIERYLALSTLGQLRLADVTKRDCREFVRWLRTRPSKQKGLLAPRTVRGVYDVIRRVFEAAVDDDVLTVNPMAARPVRKELPTIVDKIPGARETWRFNRHEVALLISHPDVPAPRRVLWALLFLTGPRHGEVAVLRWRDIDFDVEPLGRITYSRALKRDGSEGETKTGAVKRVPIHPRLEEVLRAWRDSGWEQAYGRAPTDDDLVVPTRAKGPDNDGSRLGSRLASTSNHELRRDCGRAEVRPRRLHGARHTFISLCQDDGADTTIMRRTTHAAPRDAHSLYEGPGWAAVCRELSKLAIPTP